MRVELRFPGQIVSNRAIVYAPVELRRRRNEVVVDYLLNLAEQVVQHVLALSDEEFDAFMQPEATSD